MKPNDKPFLGQEERKRNSTKILSRSNVNSRCV